MDATEQETTDQWISAADLALPTDYKDICDCADEQIEASYARLEQTSGQKLTEYYEHMGTGEMRSLKSKLFFVAAMLLEQTAESSNKRDMVKKIRELHRDNPLYPSVATVYRTIAPLKVWLGRKCEMNHAPSVGDLRKDRRPLLLLTQENLLGLVAECKTTRKFAQKYRPRRQPKNANLAPSDDSKPVSQKPATEQPATVLIQGYLTADQREKISDILGAECRLLDLNETQVEAVRQWVEP